MPSKPKHPTCKGRVNQLTAPEQHTSLDEGRSCVIEFRAATHTARNIPHAPTHTPGISAVLLAGSCQPCARLCSDAATAYIHRSRSGQQPLAALLLMPGPAPRAARNQTSARVGSHWPHSTASQRTSLVSMSTCTRSQDPAAALPLPGSTQARWALGSCTQAKQESRPQEDHVFDACTKACSNECPSPPWECQHKGMQHTAHLLELPRTLTLQAPECEALHASPGRHHYLPTAPQRPKPTLAGTGNPYHRLAALRAANWTHPTPDRMSAFSDRH